MDGVRPSDIARAQPRAMLSRRKLVVSGALLCGASLIPQVGFAQADSGPSLSDAVGVLEKERSAGEQYAVILAMVGRKNVDAYVRGIQLYADAKADFDGLISQLRFDLIDGRDPTRSAKFAAALEAAAKKPYRLHQLCQR